MIYVKSNAKINLYLKVVGVESELHKLETVMCPISIYDEICIEESLEDKIEGMELPLCDNIMYKALNLFRREYNIDKCYAIKIKKDIPMMAGLGGGSSNAVAVLKALYYLNNIEIDDKVYDLAFKCGSDCAFFVNNKISFVTGTGNILKNANTCYVYGVLVFDKVYVSTKCAFNMIDKLGIRSEPCGCEENDENNFYNDLEKGLDKETYEKITQIKSRLKENQACVSIMSGSGGSVFGLFNTIEKRNDCYKKIKNEYSYVRMFEIL